MAWSGAWPVAAGTELAPLFAELGTAYSERAQVTAGAPTIGGAVGDDIQAYDGVGAYGAFRTWQEWIEDAASAVGRIWIRNDVTYHQTGAATDSESWRWTLADLRSAAGLNASGFTRKYWRTHANAAAGTYSDGSAFADGHRSLRLSDGLVYDRTAGAWVLVGGCWGSVQPDTVTAYGLIEAGDIWQGAHLWNELYRCFRLLTWTRHLCTWDGQQNFASGSDAVWNTAKANAEAQFDGGTLIVDDDDFALFDTHAELNAGTYTAYMYARKARAGVAVTPAHVARTVEHYVYAVDPLEYFLGIDLTYDANGYGVTRNDWSRITTTGPNTSTTTQYSSYLGNLDNTLRPAWCDVPLNATSDSKARGFRANPAAAPNLPTAIVKWDFTKP